MPATRASTAKIGLRGRESDTRRYVAEAHADIQIGPSWAGLRVSTMIRRMNYARMIGLAVAVLLSVMVFGAPPREGKTDAGTQPTSRDAAAAGKAAEDKLSTTHHELKLAGGETMRYEATAGTLALKD